MLRYLKIIIGLLFFLGTYSSALAQDDNCFPKKPQPARLVNDLAGIFSEEQKLSLEKELQDFSLASSNQLLILTVNDLCGNDPATFSFDIGEKWGVGQKKFDNGIVLLVKPKDNTKGQVFIAVGYGLEGAITDASTKRLVETVLIPHFKANDYFGGIQEASSQLMKIAVGEFDESTYADNSGDENDSGFFIIFGLLLVIIVIAMVSHAKKAKAYSKKHNVSFYAAWNILNALSAMNRSSRRGYGGNSHISFGGGSSPFGGSGGFGGFGGGSFGGGGAGGSW